MYLKLMIDGVGSIPFSASSLPPFPEQIISYKSEVIAYSRKNFSKPRAEVEEVIRKWNEEANAPIKPPVSAASPIKPAMTATTPPKTVFSQGQKTYQPAPVPKTFVQRPEIKKSYEEKSSPRIEIKKEELPKIIPPKFTRSEEPKYKRDFPPMEEEAGGDFLPLKELAKKFTRVENKIEKIAEDNRIKSKSYQTKEASEKNLSDLKSVLASVMKKTEVTESEKQTIKNSKNEVQNKKEESKVESKKRIKEEPKPQTKEIPEEDLKKVLGI